MSCGALLSALAASVSLARGWGGSDSGLAQLRARYSAGIAATYSFRFGRQAPFAPSNASVRGGGFLPPSAFPSAEYCGHCHAAAYAQWKDSLHRNSFREPFYTKNVKILNDGQGIEYSRHCEACHNPIALFSGALTPNSKVDRAFDDAGVTCTVCHSILAVQRPVTGNGSYVMGVPAVMTDAVGHRIPGVAPDAEILAHPERHARAVMQPFYRTPEFCGTCHESTLPAVLAGYKWLVGFRTYDEWDASAYSHRSPLTFYQKPVTTCQTCHMAPEAAGAGEAAARNGVIASHRWLGGNTATPFYYGATSQMRKETAFLSDHRLQVSIFSLAKAPGAGAATPITPEAAPLKHGEAVEALVLISNIGLGHSLIPEQRDIFEAWLEFTAADATGKVIWRSGAILPDGRLDPSAHSFTNRLVAADGSPLREHQIWQRRAVAFDNTVASGKTALARYQFRIPAGAKLPVTLTGRVRYRHFNEHYLDFALGPGHAAYPVVTLASTSSQFAQTGVAIGERDWRSWNDLGIALLGQSEFGDARAAFQRVLALRPGYADGLTNLAIATSGLFAFDEAAADVSEAAKLAAANNNSHAAARALFYRGLIERNQDGEANASVADLQAALRAYPESRQVLHQLGVSEYLARADAPAQRTFAALLANDPNDLLGHYYLAVLERRAGLEKDSAAQATWYEDEKPNAGEGRIALAYLRAHPEVRDESIAGHVHIEPGLTGSPDEATRTRPELRGRALPPGEFRPQPDRREGVLRRAAVPPQLTALAKAKP